jgi:hypothetical protein
MTNVVDINTAARWVLYLTREHLMAVRNATDLSARLMIGQVQEMFSFITDWEGRPLGMHHDDSRALHYLVQRYAGLSGGPGSNWGVTKFPQADLLFDINDVVRNRIAWDSNPPRDIVEFTNHHDRPNHWRADVPLVDVYATPPADFAGDPDLDPDLIYKLDFNAVQGPALLHALEVCAAVSCGSTDDGLGELLDTHGFTAPVPIAVYKAFEVVIEMYTERSAKSEEGFSVFVPTEARRCLDVAEALRLAGVASPRSLRTTALERTADGPWDPSIARPHCARESV